MDAYSDYLLRTANARLGRLRREAAEHSISCATRGARTSWWRRAFRRLPELFPDPLGSGVPSEALERT